MNFVALVMKKENNLLDFLAGFFWRISCVFVAKVRITMQQISFARSAYVGHNYTHHHYATAGQGVLPHILLILK